MTEPVVIPIRTYSKLNGREHWAKRARRTKAERRAAFLMVPSYAVAEPTTVTLTRIAPRRLDGDNLQGSFKAVRDAVADRMGIDDADPRVTWRYAQEKGAPKEYAVRVEIQADRETRGSVAG